MKMLSISSYYDMAIDENAESLFRAPHFSIAKLPH